MGFAEATISRSTISYVMVVLLLLGGWIAYRDLGRFEDPEFVIRDAVITTTYPGAPAQTVADEVTDRIETAIRQLQEVKEVRSVSRPGRSEVTVSIKMEFAPTKADLEKIWSKVRAKVDDAQRQLPPGAGPSMVNDDFGDVFALFFAVTGEGYSAVEIGDYVRDIADQIKLVKGVARVATLGAADERVYVEISRERMAAVKLSLDRVYSVLQSQSQISLAGDVVADGLRLPINASGGVGSLDDIKSLVVSNGDGPIIHLSDIAEVKRGVAEPASMLVRYNGQPAIGVGVSGVTGGNIVDVGDAVRARLNELEPNRPLGMDLHVISWQSDSVRASVDGFVENLVAALVIVVLVLLAFMGFRAALIIGAILLLTVCGTLIAMLFAGIAMHRISLGALIIALGMLVDNAIVVIDGTLVRAGRGMPVAEAANETVRTTQWPLLGGTAVGILAFSAIGFSPTSMGEYAGSLFWVVCYSMLLSWLFAITLTPLFSVHFLGRPKALADAKAGDSRIAGGFRHLLATAVRHARLTAACSLVPLGLAIWGFGFVTPGFMPDSARPQFVIDAFLPQGTDIASTAARMTELEAVVSKEQGVAAVSTFVGGGALRFMLSYSPEAMNSAYGQLLVDVSDGNLIPALVGKLQTELSQDFPDTEVKVWKFMLGKGGGKKIEAAFSGPDPVVLRTLADKAKDIFMGSSRLIAVQDDWRTKVATVEPVFNAAAGQRVGVTLSDVNAALAETYVGRRVGVFRDGEDLIPIVVRQPAEDRGTLADLENVQVRAASGRTIPIAQVVSGTRLAFRDAIIRRIDGLPTIKAQADPQPGLATSAALADVREAVEAIPLQPGYSLAWHGEYKDSKEANEGLAQSAPYGFASMVLAVVVMFNALRQAAVIWLTVPLSIIGVTVGLLLFGVRFEFMAILGFLSLTGMLVKNAIVLVDQIDADIAEGRERFTAVVEATLSRVRPVVLGAATTVLGVLPLLLDPFFKSMAVTIIFGLIFATALTLVMVPVLYAVFFRVRPSDCRNPVG